VTPGHFSGYHLTCHVRGSLPGNGLVGGDCVRLSPSGTVGLVVIRHYKTCIKSIPPGCALPLSRAVVPEGWKPLAR